MAAALMAAALMALTSLMALALFTTRHPRSRNFNHLSVIKFSHQDHSGSLKFSKSVLFTLIYLPFHAGNIFSIEALLPYLHVL